jgi:hypothetical protein
VARASPVSVCRHVWFCRSPESGLCSLYSLWVSTYFNYPNLTKGGTHKVIKYMHVKEISTYGG